MGALRQAVGANLRRARHWTGYSPAEAGRLVGRDGSVVLRYERGELGVSLELLEAFARAYGVSLVELLAVPTAQRAKGAA